MNYERERGCFSENYVEKFKKIQRLIIFFIMEVIMDLDVCKNSFKRIVGEA